MMGAKEVVDTVGGVLTKILGDNEPQVTYNQVLANAVPKGVEPSELPSSRWSTLELFYKGVWKFWPDSDAVIKVRFAHSARYKNGGAWIPSVVAWVEQVDLAPRSKLNVTFQASPPYPYGDKAPIAALPIRIDIHENGVPGKIQNTHQYVFYGSGYIEKA